MLGSEEHKQIIATKVYATHVILFVVREKKLFCKLLQLCSLKYFSLHYFLYSIRPQSFKFPGNKQLL